MSPTFKELLDEGWIIAGYGPIPERNHPSSLIKRHIQIHHEKGKVVKCFMDPENDNFIVAHRNKDLRDYFGLRKNGGIINAP